jgi:hypothetical protein
MVFGEATDFNGFGKKRLRKCKSCGTKFAALPREYHTWIISKPFYLYTFSLGGYEGGHPI